MTVEQHNGVLEYIESELNFDGVVSDKCSVSDIMNEVECSREELVKMLGTVEYLYLRIDGVNDVEVSGASIDVMDDDCTVSIDGVKPSELVTWQSKTAANG